MSSGQGTFGVAGIPCPQDVQHRTDPQNGIPHVTGMPLRYEISEFFERMSRTNDPIMQKQWTLFVEALTRFKALPVEDMLSYFQIAGIHGSPQQPWDGAGPPPSTPHDPPPGQNPYGGYCQHNTVAFPIWHRVYLLLYEQCIWLNMKLVIEEWVRTNALSETDAASWASAAATWRLFYWDWAREQRYPTSASPGAETWNDFGIPYLFSVRQVPIFSPTGKTTAPNPLWHFENPERDPLTKRPLPFGQMPKGKERFNIPNYPATPDPKKPWQVAMPWASCTATSRWGILYNPETKQYTGLEGKNDYKSSNIALSTTASRLIKPKQGDMTISEDDWNHVKPGNLADAVSRMFSAHRDDKWSTFASTKWHAETEADMRPGYLSLEYIHNNIHNITGGSSLGPHVGEDPQDPQDAETDGIHGCGHMCDVPVAAFDPIFWMHHCNIDRYTAMWQCLNWQKWFEEEPTPTQGAHIADVKPDDPLEPFHLRDGGDPNDRTNKWTSNQARDWTKLNYQYDDLMPDLDALDCNGKLISDVYKSDLRRHIHTLYPGTGHQAWAIREAEDINNVAFFGGASTFEDYIISVVYDRYALDGDSYAIEFSIDGDCVGQVYSLGGLRPAGCANCKKQKAAGVLSRAQVPIAIPIMRKAADPSFDALDTYKANGVEDFLADNLSVRYVGPGGSVVSASEFPKTEISVLASKAVWSLEGGTGRDAGSPPYYVQGAYRLLPRATQRLQRADAGARSSMTKPPRSRVSGHYRAKL